MTKKNKLEIKVGETVHLKVQSGEIIEGRVMHVRRLNRNSSIEE